VQVQGLSIKCARVGDVEIPNNKRIEYSLQYIHGVGRSRARQILCDISMDNKLTKELTQEEIITLKDEVSRYMIEGDLVMKILLLHFCFPFSVSFFVNFDIVGGLRDDLMRLI